MNRKEALERIKRSHRIAMDMLVDGQKDEETEKAIGIVEKDLETLSYLEPLQSRMGIINWGLLFVKLDAQAVVYYKRVTRIKGKTSYVIDGHNQWCILSSKEIAILNNEELDEVFDIKDYGKTWSFTEADLKEEI